MPQRRPPKLDSLAYSPYIRTETLFLEWLELFLLGRNYNLWFIFCNIGRVRKHPWSQKSTQENSTD